jgi:hypothetical protein
MAHQGQRLEVHTILEPRQIKHAAHPTQATKPMPAHVSSALEAEDITSCVGYARLTNDGVLRIQLKALPIDGRLLIRLPVAADMA